MLQGFFYLNEIVLFSKSESNLFDLDSLAGFGGGSTETATTTKMSKDSILALFNQPISQQQQQQHVGQPHPQLPNFMTDFGAGQKVHPFASNTFLSTTPCASPPPRPPFFLIIFFLFATLSTRMTGISLQMQLASDFAVAWQYSQREQ
jgi:hypothetical protein